VRHSPCDHRSLARAGAGYELEVLNRRDGKCL
jgi:hypothetical protein